MAVALIKITTTLIILCAILLSSGCSEKDNPTTSYPPEIDSLLVIMGPDLISGSALNAIPISSVITLTCLASDPGDDADILTFSWLANSGQFNRSDSSTVRWTAPDSTVTATITVTVSDGANSVSESISLGVVMPGALSNGSVSPGSGNTDDVFVYEVVFTDSENQPPLSATVIIDDVPHVMSMVSGSYAGGALFRYESLMAGGAHRCYYQFIDSKAITAYFPQNAYLPDPMVTEPGPVLSDDLIIIDLQPNVILESISGTVYTYSYTGIPPKISPGDFIMGVDSAGYLRHVQSVAAGNGQIILETDDAALEQILGNVTFDTTIILTPEFGKSGGGEKLMVEYLAPGVGLLDDGLDLTGLSLFSVNSAGVEISAVVTEGRLEFLPQVNIGLRLGSFEIEEFHAILSGTLNLPLEVSLSCNGGFETPPELEDIELATLVFYHSYPLAGPLPLIARYSLSYRAEFEASATSPENVVCGFDYTNPVSAGAVYEVGSNPINNDWTSVWDAPPNNFTGNRPIWDHGTNVNIRVAIKPRLSIDLFSAPGPIIELQPYFGFSANSDVPQKRSFCWDWQLTAGTNGSNDFQINMIGSRPIEFISSNTDMPVTLDTDQGCFGNGVVINSEPAGASIYFDNTNMLEMTPYVIENIDPGQHHVRLYLQGYNEYEQYFDIGADEMIRIDAVLSQPEMPYPVFEIYEPLNDTVFSDNVITVSGLIQLDDGSGQLMPFDNNHAILTLNNVDQIIAVNNGLFEQEILIIDGENNIQLRASSSAGETGVSENITVYGIFGSTDIEISLVWNSPNADLDLHIWNPLGYHYFWGLMGNTDGSLNIDDTHGYGPEIFTAPDALDGDYTVIVNCHNLKGDPYTDATIQVKINGGPTEVYGPHRFTVSDHDDSTMIPEAWWEAVEFTISGGKADFTSGSNIPSRKNKIMLDRAFGPKPTRKDIQ